MPSRIGAPTLPPRRVLSILFAPRRPDLGDHGCGVCALDPGITETAMQEEVRRLDFPDRERFVAAHEERTSRSAEEVAAAVYELACREPQDLNGRTFRMGAL